jgi:hypothetical protein
MLRNISLSDVHLKLFNYIYIEITANIMTAQAEKNQIHL